MFGHDKQDDGQQGDAQSPTPPAAADDSIVSGVLPEELSLPAPEDDGTKIPVATQSDDDSSSDSTPQDFSVPAQPDPSPVPNDTLGSPSIEINSHGDMGSNLSSLKQDALLALSPLIDKLDQSPQEKYDTAKMVYEETKDQKVLSAIYEAAKNLPDDKAKAEAIYDVVKKIDELK